ncbi:amidohydrolase family protein [Paraglaciecola aquimarina]|uniref:Amidohydrolase family protein n=1 Tax=Paraglaciecola aquimarina TaxID=1235557 RepID=A0ABU3SYL6_9ALTE|nr:amidohydrolase family protein [Paraglaciecola aquimarina]MDU0355108.1 amidohydrolase family protein [Paraglaciecola aquimarina]
MLKIDSHQHFWHFTEKDYGWIGDDEKAIKQDFLPNHLSSLLAENNIDGCVAVQARQSLEETNWLIELAESHNFIKGVVGWIDLKSADLAQQLDGYRLKKCLKGFRHVLQGEPDPNFMLDPTFVRGLNTLAGLGYRYDLLIFSHQLPQALELVKQVPTLQIVVDHIAKPKIKEGLEFNQWKDLMLALGKYQNISCKVSGMVTEADPNDWNKRDFIPYLDTVFQAFGEDRIMFGSDWPVCLLGGTYSDIKQIVAEYVESTCPQAFDKIFGMNAIKFYQL